MAKYSISIFQSTLPSRGATNDYMMLCDCVEISIHAPLAGSDIPTHNKHTTNIQFQSTLPSRGATLINQPTTAATTFQSTLPSRGATAAQHYKLPEISISIHAPLAGSDADGKPSQPEHTAFQSTLPSRGATSEVGNEPTKPFISIHAPLAGSDGRSASQTRTVTYFNPRSPRGERLLP